MFNTGGLFSMLSAILSSLGGAGSALQGIGGMADVLKPIADVGSAISPIMKGVGSVGDIMGAGTKLATSGGGGGNVIGERSGGIQAASGQQVPSLTPQDARIGLANLKSEGAAQGLSAMSDDAYMEQLASQLGIDVNQLRQMLQTSGSAVGGQ